MFLFYGFLPLLIGNGVNVGLHHALKGVLLVPLITVDRGRGAKFPSGFDVFSDGLLQSFLFMLDLLLALHDTMLQSQVFRNTFFLGIFGDKHPLAVDLDAGMVSTGWQLRDGWQLDSRIQLLLFCHFYLAFPGRFCYDKRTECPYGDAWVVFLYCSVDVGSIRERMDRVGVGSTGAVFFVACFEKQSIGIKTSEWVNWLLYCGLGMQKVYNLRYYRKFRFVQSHYYKIHVEVLFVYLYLHFGLF